MKLSILAIATSFAALFGSSFCNAQTTITFEELPLGGSGFYNAFRRRRRLEQPRSIVPKITTRGDWSGWAYSNITTLQLRDLEINMQRLRRWFNGGGGVASAKSMRLHTAITTWPDSRFRISLLKPSILQIQPTQHSP